MNLVASILKKRRPPAEEVADWIEHVIKYGGEHLRPASIDIPLYELYMLDVLAILLPLLLIITFIVFLMAKFMYKMLCNSARQKAKI